MTITSDTTRIIFTHSATEKESVHKDGAILRLLGDYVYLEYPDSSKKIKLDYNNVTDPVVASAEDLYDELNTMLNA